MNKITERQKDLSLKFLKMGQALTKEGLAEKDFVIVSLGNYLTFMSTIVYSERDLQLFNQLSNMMSSRNLIERISNGEISDEELDQLRDISEEPSETIPEMVKRMHGKIPEGDNDDNDDDDDDVDNNPEGENTSEEEPTD
jgi:predicted ribonuclease toxin of YeeF-YezG toxin-antitoxin module